MIETSLDKHGFHEILNNWLRVKFLFAMAQAPASTGITRSPWTHVRQFLRTNATTGYVARRRAQPFSGLVDALDES